MPARPYEFYKGVSLTVGDWRDGYIVCEHVAKLPTPAATGDLRHSGFRVCCQACYPDFLFPPEG